MLPENIYGIQLSCKSIVDLLSSSSRIGHGDRYAEVFAGGLEAIRAAGTCLFSAVQAFSVTILHVV